MDHIHILFSSTPNINLSKLINVNKTTSSRYVRKEYRDHINKFYWKPYFWSRGYLILSSGGAPIEKIKNYIENQGQDREG